MHVLEDLLLIVTPRATPVPLCLQKKLTKVDSLYHGPYRMPAANSHRSKDNTASLEFDVSAGFAFAASANHHAILVGAQEGSTTMHKELFKSLLATMQRTML